MKKIFLLAVFLLAVLMLSPLGALSSTEKPDKAITPVNTTVKAEANSEYFKVLISDTDEIKELSVSDYIFGVVSAEMPVLYETEALKAQAVCAYTFALWRQKENNDKDYDITDNFKIDQAYISKKEALEKWGDKADEYSKKIESAISETKNQFLSFNDEVILSVYHAVSSGSTESAENVWGKDYPYLQSVSSVGDKLAKNYISQKSVTTADLKTAFEGLAEITDTTENPFSDFERTAAGSVKSVNVCGKSFTGSEIREIFDLKSANFETSFKDNLLTFTVYGYGHGVGMSQNGANYMAQQGSDYKEILTHYYKGCEIINKQ